VAPRCGCAGRRHAVARRWREAWGPSDDESKRRRLSTTYTPARAAGRAAATRYAARHGAREDGARPCRTRPPKLWPPKCTGAGVFLISRPFLAVMMSVFDRTDPITTSSLWDMGLLDDQDIYQYKLLLYNVLPPFFNRCGISFFLKIGIRLMCVYSSNPTILIGSHD